MPKKADCTRTTRSAEVEFHIVVKGYGLNTFGGLWIYPGYLLDPKTVKLIFVKKLLFL
jgi:hypothetical protein